MKKVASRSCKEHCLPQGKQHYSSFPYYSPPANAAITGILPLLSLSSLFLLWYKWRTLASPLFSICTEFSLVRSSTFLQNTVQWITSDPVRTFYELSCSFTARACQHSERFFHMPFCRKPGTASHPAGALNTTASWIWGNHCFAINLSEVPHERVAVPPTEVAKLWLWPRPAVKMVFLSV